MERTQPQSLLPIRSVQAQTNLGRTKIYDLIRKGDFPAPIKLGARTARWPAAAIDAWIQKKIDAQAAA
ncbi:hypothetical protein ZRA01_38130 [Zoogloea ramigera]|jgi:prophage regulatory protein|uniref:AlpA family transcriptional regulator n=1 Tax=Zoogloea ramigera TaxID=350 RepID=A0A4Y4D4P7_ZOORA|nr:AlpA family phage regulatory protein [Zoogloea ramigera]GEC97740.1 hypothetical protein ZRA01_38130 [Zoogloea ramigera]